MNQKKGWSQSRKFESESKSEFRFLRSTMEMTSGLAAKQKSKGLRLNRRRGINVEDGGCNIYIPPKKNS